MIELGNAGSQVNAVSMLCQVPGSYTLLHSTRLYTAVMADVHTSLMDPGLRMDS